MQNTVLINNSRTNWQTNTLMPFFSFSDNFLQNGYIIFDNFEIFAHNMLNNGLGCSSFLKGLNRLSFFSFFFNYKKDNYKEKFRQKVGRIALIWKKDQFCSKFNRKYTVWTVVYVYVITLEWAQLTSVITYLYTCY